jgi:hypothetical protein
MRIGRLCALAGATLALAACGENTVAQDELEAEVKRVLTEEVGTAPKSISCPGDLKAEKGEKMTCELEAPNGEKVKAQVTVTEVEGDNAKFDVEVVE